MLLRFEVGNHRSIREPVELSMIAVDDDRAATRGFEAINERALTVAAIYGPNASGKSNVLDALGWLSAAVSRSLRQWDDHLPRVPFRFADGPALATTFEVEMIVESVRYTYRLEVDDTSVRYESLHSYPERRRRVLFERDETRLTFRRGLSSQSGIRELLTSTTLALSAALRFDDSQIDPFGRALAGIGALSIRTPDGLPFWVAEQLPSRTLIGSATTSEFFAGDDAERGVALGMLRLADLGIDEVEIVEDGLNPVPKAPHGPPSVGSTTFLRDRR